MAAKEKIMVIYHITPRADWKQAKTAGVYTADSLNTEGFIHCSTEEQVIGTANFLFRGQQDLILLQIDTEKLTAEVRFESPPESDTKFPHIYGPLNLDAVIEVLNFPPREDGTFSLPPELTRKF